MEDRLTWAGPLLTLLVCAAAIRHGGPAERGTGVVVIVAQAAALLAAILSAPQPWPVITADLIMGVGLVGLLVRHPRPWLYGELCLLACLLLVHAYGLQDGVQVAAAHTVLVNGLNLIGLAVLAVATAGSVATRSRISRRKGRHSAEGAD